ncbi:helix-turn-helix domain-containing protein [Ferrimicrobium sp.]
MIKLEPNNRKANYLPRARGTARFTYDWVLACWKAQYEPHELNPSILVPNQYSLRRELRQ